MYVCMRYLTTIFLCWAAATAALPPIKSGQTTQQMIRRKAQANIDRMIGPDVHIHSYIHTYTHSLTRMRSVNVRKLNANQIANHFTGRLLIELTDNQVRLHTSDVSAAQVMSASPRMIGASCWQRWALGPAASESALTQPTRTGRLSAASPAALYIHTYIHVQYTLALIRCLSWLCEPSSRQCNPGCSSLDICCLTCWRQIYVYVCM